MTTTNRPRYNAQRVINLHCGFGRDSVAMVLLAAEGRLVVDDLGADVELEDLDAIVFSDTGVEWPHTYAVIDRVRELVAGRCPVVVLAKVDGMSTADRYRPAGWGDIEAQAELGAYHARPDLVADFQSRQTVASLGKGDCTDNHKIQPLRRFMSHQHALRFDVKDNAARGRQIKKGEAQPSLVLIGIAADELSRLEGDHKRPSYVEERYPLISMGIAKADEAPILQAHGLGDVRKSGCWACPYQPAGWWWALSVTEPVTFERAVNYELAALARNPRMSVTGIKRAKRDGGDLVLLPELVQRWRAANPDATVDAVLDKQYSRCTKDARAMKRAEVAELAADVRRLPMVAA